VADALLLLLLLLLLLFSLYLQHEHACVQQHRAHA
jgi:hypothetical protein